MRDFIVRKFKDPHQHLREGSELPYTLQWAAHWCSTVVAMPNLAEPLTTVGRIRDYEELIRCYNTEKLNVIVPLYLTQNTTPDDIQAASASGVMAAKAYPRGKTSHSALGIGDYRRMTPVFEEMARVGMRLLLHPEHPEKNAWEGEQAFFSSIWPGIYQIVDSLGLYVSLEHISNGTTLGYIESDSTGRVVGTVTPHHLLAHIGHLGEQWDSAYFCKPMLKAPLDRDCLLEAVLSGSRKLLLGSDSAPWSLDHKHKYRPCSGCWSTPWLPQLLATIFELTDDTDRDALERFSHDNAVDWWGWEPSTEFICISPGETRIPETDFGYVPGYLPFWGGKTLFWKAEVVSSQDWFPGRPQAIGWRRDIPWVPGF